MSSPLFRPGARSRALGLVFALLAAGTALAAPRLELRASLPASGPVLAVACAHDGRRALATTTGGDLLLFQLEPAGARARELARLRVTREPLLGTGFLGGTGRPFAHDRSAIHLFDDALRSEPRRLTAGGFEIRAASPSRDGARLLAAAPNGELVLWSTESGRVLARRPPFGFPPFALTHLPDGTVLLASADGTARLLDERSLEERRRFAIPSGNEVIVAVAAGGTRLLATGGRTPSACSWEIASGKQHGCLGGGAAIWTSAAALGADGEHILLASPSGELTAWSAGATSAAARLALGAIATSLAVCPLGGGDSLVLAGTEDGAVHILRF